MKNHTRIIVLGFILILLHVLPATILQFIKIEGIAPNFMLMLIVSIALIRGSKEGALLGIAAGIINDILFGRYIIFSVVNYALIGYMCGKLHKKFYRENYILPFFCTFASSLYLSVVTMITFLVQGKSNFLYLLKSIVIPEVIYTTAVSLIIYQVIYVINAKIEDREKNTRNLF